MQSLKLLPRCAAALLGAVFLLFPKPTVAANVSVDVGSAVVEPDGTATVDVTLHSNGNAVVGVQNSILFDSRVLQLPDLGRCTIGPEIGYAAPGCNEDPPQGSCLFLNRNVANCGTSPLFPECYGQPRYVSVAIAIVFDFSHAPAREIPDGAIVYRCKFDVVDADALPAFLKNTHVVASDAMANSLGTEGADGYVSNDPLPGPTWTPRPLGAIGAACVFGRDCGTGYCDPSRPQGDRGQGTCADPSSLIATPTPEGLCLADEDCAEGLHCNFAEGGFCCTERECPAGLSCRLPGQEGACASLPTPTPTPRVTPAVFLDYEITKVDERGQVILTATLDGENIDGVQNDLVFDSDAIRLAGDSACKINPAIGTRQEGCREYPPLLPCLTLIQVSDQCENESSESCQGHDGTDTWLRLLLRQVDVSNQTPLDRDVELFSCTFEIVDASLLPTRIGVSSVLAKVPAGQQLPVGIRIHGDAAEVASNAFEIADPGADASGDHVADDGCSIVVGGGANGWWLFAAALVLGVIRRRAS